MDRPWLKRLSFNVRTISSKLFGCTSQTSKRCINTGLMQGIWIISLPRAIPLNVHNSLTLATFLYSAVKTPFVNDWPLHLHHCATCASSLWGRICKFITGNIAFANGALLFILLCLVVRNGVELHFFETFYYLPQITVIMTPNRPLLTFNKHISPIPLMIYTTNRFIRVCGIPN